MARAYKTRDYVIFHPTDFSTASASEMAFYHALKIALQSGGELQIMHVERGRRKNKALPAWTEFPGVRRTLGRWGIGLKQTGLNRVSGVHVTKFISAGTDPVESMLRHFRKFPPDRLLLSS